MKYIEKDMAAPRVLAYEAELKQAQLDQESLATRSEHSHCKGADIYDMVKSLPGFRGLKEQLFADQGGICCYCGRRLQYPTTPQYIVEHVLPKDIHRTLAGEYSNLLLSCRPSDEEERARRNAPKKVTRQFFHCDKSKGATEINYPPLQPDCATHYAYDQFTGEVLLTDEHDARAQHDLAVLNLNCDWLKRRRLAAIEGALYDESGELLPDEELRACFSTVMQRRADGTYREYCFVIHDVLSSLLTDL